MIFNLFVKVSCPAELLLNFILSTVTALEKLSSALPLSINFMSCASTKQFVQDDHVFIYIFSWQAKYFASVHLDDVDKPWSVQ